MNVYHESEAAIKCHVLEERNEIWSFFTGVEMSKIIFLMRFSRLLLVSSRLYPSFSGRQVTLSKGSA